MSKKANAAVVILMVLVVVAMFTYFARYSPPKVVQLDPTRQVVTESSGAARKSVFVGVGNAMHNGLSPMNKAWFCNRPFPPSFTEANMSLESSTNELLKKYFRGLRGAEYYNEFENITFNIGFPLNDTAEILVPGWSVIITDLSGSMKWTLGGRVKFEIVKDMNQLAVKTAFSNTPSTRIGLVDYAEDVKRAYPLTNDKEELLLEIENQNNAEGGTCIACGIYRAVEMLAPPPVRLPYDRKRPLSIILMSDGGTNTCFGDSGILDECKVLHYSASSVCARSIAQAQAIAYAEEAYQTYGIKFFTVIFNTDYCPPIVPNPLDCYDPDTMEQVACAGGNCSNFVIGDNEDELKAAYERYGRDVARFNIENFTYLKLEDDIINAFSNNILVGANFSELQTKENISDEYLWDFKTWLMYKKVVTWLYYYGDSYLLESEFIKARLTNAAPCNAVFQGATCPPVGKVYEEHNESYEKMLLKPGQLFPHKILDEIQINLNKYLNDTNMSCFLEYSDFNLTNTPMFDFRSDAPVYLRPDTPFGNGTYRQSSNDGVNPRIECPTEGVPPNGRENFLGSKVQYSIGNIGPALAINPTCNAGAYQYIGIDRTLKMDILVKCQDPTIGAIMDGPWTFEPLTLEFIIRVDMMSDCDPPVDRDLNVLEC